MKTILRWLYKPVFQLELFIVLLVVTPFLMLQNYLQTAVLTLTRFSIPVGGIQIPVVPLIVLIIATGTILLVLRKMTLQYWLTLAAVILLMALAQKTTDFFLNNRFYDLQINWHYFAYGIFSFILYRVLEERKYTAHKRILTTYLTALAISTFDEAIQVFISNRIFDICDIAKDLYGASLGMLLIAFIVENGRIIKDGWGIHQQSLKGYLTHSWSLLVLQFVFSYILMFVSSNLTDISYWYLNLILSMGIFALVFLIIHLSQFRIPRYFILGIAGLVVAGLGISFTTVGQTPVRFQQYGVIVYRGIPLPFFDVMINGHGGFRFVDKKHEYNRRDLLTIYEHVEEILLIGTGEKGLGGMGFPEDEVIQFVLNPITYRVIQVIRLNTPLACEQYNRLIAEGHHVVFVTHSTC